ncbi:MAG TPA: hypothetical protein VJN92_20960 [Candidatus Acidoferrum sp.]|nr:hypothetical protein [Candidatus Acidoferrum sp.]
MAAEEDKKFDAVLGGFLVNDLRIRAGDLHCPDSDTLAAFHERSLLPEEMNSWKEHIVGCARCQAILAELEATDSLPLQLSENEEVLTAAAATADAASESSSARKEVPETLPAKSRVTPISRGVRWQWLAPAGALAAGLIIWVAWRENRSLLNPPTEIKTARLEPPAAPPPPVTRDGREAASAEELSRISKDQSAVGSAVAKPSPETKNLKQFEKPDTRGRVASSEPHTDKETGARADTVLDSLAAANRAQQPAKDAKAGVAGAQSETVVAETLAESAESQNQQAQRNLQAQQNQLKEQKISGPNPSRHAEQKKKSKDESPALMYRAAAAPQPSAPPPAAAFSNDGAAVRMASAISPYVISAPDGKTSWRVGHVGMIEFSSDGGASWSRQISNVSVELTAGSAPSEKVCWIVGQAGTILLTTDAGAHWTTIHSPFAEDLGGVRAPDALHATIWNLGITKAFETSDGGLTWKPAQAK